LRNNGENYPTKLLISAITDHIAQGAACRLKKRKNPIAKNSIANYINL
jgi:hypothetical protein